MSRCEPGSEANTRTRCPGCARANQSFNFNKGKGHAKPVASISACFILSDMKLASIFSNLSQSTRAARFSQGLLLSLGILGLVSWARSDIFIGDLPNMGAADVRMQQEQVSSGLRYLRFLNARGLVRQDPALQYYLEQSTTPLLPAFAGIEARRDLTLLVVEQDTFNAFAVPGGIIGVHVGLLKELGTTAEVQAILAHELGHLALGHHQRIAQGQRQTSGWVIASLLLAPLAWQIDPEVAIGMVYGVQGAAIQQQLAFSRQMEEEADRFAVSALRSAHIPLSDLIQAFETMANLQRSQVGELTYHYPSTHPDIRARLTDLRNRIDRAVASQPAPPDIPLCWIQHDLQRTPLVETSACQKYAAASADGAALMDAMSAWKSLWEAYPGHPFVLFRASEWMLKQTSLPAEFTQNWQQQTQLSPDNWLVALAVLSLAEQAQIELTQTEQERWQSQLLWQAPSNDQSSWSLLSRLYDNDADRAVSLRAQAQLRWIAADVTSAIRIMRRAVELSGAGSQRARWESILRDWERSLSR